MFSLDTKQWESVASGLMSSVTKKEAAKPTPDAKTPDLKIGDRKAEPPVELVAVLAEER